MRVPCTCGSDVPGLHAADCPRSVQLTVAMAASLIGGLALYRAPASRERPSGRITQRIPYQTIASVYEAWCGEQAVWS